MTQRPAAPAMTTLVEAVHLDAPSGVPNAVVRIVVPTVVLPGIGTVVLPGVGTVVLPGVGTVVLPGVGKTVVGTGVGKTVVGTEVLEAGQIARGSAAVRCWRRKSRGCPSPPFPKA